MRSPKSFGKLKRPKLLIRRITGDSMLPTFQANQVVIASGWPAHFGKQDTVIFMHHGLEKIKRIQEVDPQRGVFVIGDNPSQSTDSRSFGWIDFDEISAKVIWPRTKNPSRA